MKYINKILIVLIVLSLQSCSSQQSTYKYNITNRCLKLKFSNINYPAFITREGMISIPNKEDYEDFAHKLIDYGSYPNRQYPVLDYFGDSNIRLYYNFFYEGFPSLCISISNFYTPEIVFRISKPNAIILGNKLLTDLNLMN